jgi:hypothetical protein
MVFDVPSKLNRNLSWICSYLGGALAKLRKVTVSFGVPVCPSVSMKQLGSHWTDFYEKMVFEYFFRKSAAEVQVSLIFGTWPEGLSTFMISP